MASSSSSKAALKLIPTFLPDLSPRKLFYVTGNAMRAIIPKDLFDEFDRVIKEGPVYKIVSTELEPISGGVDEFPRFWFSLASMDEINTRGPGHPLLTDVMKVQKSTGEIKDKKDIVIRLISGHELTVNFWEHHMQKLVPDQLLGQETKPVLVVAATIVKDYLGNKYLSSSSATTLFVNPDFPEVHEIKRRFANDKTPVLFIGEGDGNAGDGFVAEELTIDRFSMLIPNDIKS
ncbi:Nucleic acid-binding protein [Corchorus olitorius]|uniref:Nucleic acid-binding protein n=1 Tax=Corchorus olitorius TaxID=93759 RepID=A0A1R3ICM5_9ROSI|nr:Nucleic acid-binding protein [Corchorus olitorius]